MATCPDPRECPHCDGRLCPLAVEQLREAWGRLVTLGHSPHGMACLLLRLAGLGYDEIAGTFRPPITRQAVEKHLRHARETVPWTEHRGVILFEAEPHVKPDRRRDRKLIQ